jgi:predicted RNase H-like nuclease (RuvC/YqgF family)
LGNSKKRNLIIGIDPGITCGLAILDLDANPLVLKSEKAISVSDIITQILDIGRPIIIASDVTPTPDYIKKVASKFDSTTFVPKVLMKGEKKRELVNKFLHEHELFIKDTHVIDALAAALKAYNYYKDKFIQIENKQDPDIDLDNIKSAVVKGMRIKEAIYSLKKKKEIKKIKPTLKRKKVVSRISEKLSQRSIEIKGLKTEKKNLINKIEKLNNEISRLRTFIKKKNKEIEVEAFKDRLIQLQKREIAELSKKLRKLEIKEINQKENLDIIDQLETDQKIIFLKPIKKFSSTQVNMAIFKSDISSGDIALLMDASGGGNSAAQSLIDVGIKAVIFCNPMSHHAENKLISENIPTLSSKKLNIKWVNNRPYIETNEINNAIKKAKSDLSKKKQLIKDNFYIIQ